MTVGASAVLVACGSTPTPTPAPAPAAAAPTAAVIPTAAAAPTSALVPTVAFQPSPAASVAMKSGGHLRVSHTGQIRNLDPGKINSQDEALVTLNVFEGLVELGDDLVLRPRLAQSIDKSVDLKTWTFNLRKGIKFQHGREMTADDVVFTIQRTLDPKTASNMRSSIDMIDTVTAVDPYTVKMTLKYPYVELLAPLAAPGLVIIPKDKVDSLSQTPIGTGPFVLKSFTPGGSVELAKNPNYSGTPAILDAVTLSLISQGEVAFTSLKNGETDVMWSIPLELIDQVKQAAHVVVGEVATESWDPLVMDTRKAPFSNPKVRQAVRYAIDKDQLIKLSLAGHGTKVPFPLSPQNPLFPKDVPNVPFDLAKAKQLMADAGYANGFSTPLYLGIGRPQRVAEGIAIAEMLKAIGIQSRIQQMPLDKFFADIEFNGEFYTDGWSGDPGTDMHIYPNLHSGGTWNVAHWSNAQADALLDKSRQTASVDGRRQLYTQLGRILNDDGPYMIAWVANHADAWNDSVVGYKTHPDNFAFFRSVGFKH